jgi:16S rRNA (uracil1498-N3)-methyltransferase
MNRFFADNLNGPQVPLTDDEAHHATHVLRLGAGAEVELFDGSGRTARGRIIQAGRSKALVQIEHVNPAAARPQPIIHLAFAVPKGKRLDWLLEKATELAAASLQPVRFQRSVAGGGLDGAGRRRWLAHCIAAAKQSGLNFLPEVRQPAGLNEFLAEKPAKESSILLLGDVGEDAMPILWALRGAEKSAIRNPCLPPAGRQAKSEIVVLVGPEGGLTDSERRDALAAGFMPVRIGTTTLRTETAAVSLLAATAALLGQGEGRCATSTEKS